MKNAEKISQKYRFLSNHEKKDELLLLATAIDLLEEIRDLLRSEMRDRKDDGK